MQNKEYLEKRISEATNKVVKQMWQNALNNVDNGRKKVTWDDYFLVTGFVLNSKSDKRQVETRKKR
jgi:hypothetical protein